MTTVFFSRVETRPCSQNHSSQMGMVQYFSFTIHLFVARVLDLLQNFFSLSYFAPLFLFFLFSYSPLFFSFFFCSVCVRVRGQIFLHTMILDNTQLVKVGAPSSDDASLGIHLPGENPKIGRTTSLEVLPI
jgi:hypothetical protein